MIRAQKLVWAALGGLGVGMFSSSAGAAPCPPAVSVLGQPELVSAVATVLTGRGIATTAEAGCPVVVASLTSSKDGVAVQVVSRSGAREEETLSSPSAAATWIEERARADWVAPLLPGEPLAPPPAQPPPTDPSPAEASRSEPRVSPERPARDRASGPRPAPSSPDRATGVHVLLGGAPGVAFASDNTFWTELELRGCVELSPVCMGTIARGAVDTAASGASAKLGAHRGGIDVLLSAEFPIDLVKVTIDPGAGVGAGWRRVGHGAPPGSTSDGVEFDSGGLRLEAFLDLLTPVARRLFFDASLSLRVSPLAHTTQFSDDRIPLPGDPLVGGATSFGFRLRLP